MPAGRGRPRARPIGDPGSQGLASADPGERDRGTDEHRIASPIAHRPAQVLSATKPQLAGNLLQQAHDPGIRAGFIAGDEVYGGLDLRKSIRGRGTGYVLAVRSSHMVSLPSGRRLTVKNAADLTKPGMWQRMRTGSATKGAKDYHWAMIAITPGDTCRHPPTGLTLAPSQIPASVPLTGAPTPTFRWAAAAPRPRRGPATTRQRPATTPVSHRFSPPHGAVSAPLERHHAEGENRRYHVAP